MTPRTLTRIGLCALLAGGMAASAAADFHSAAVHTYDVDVVDYNGSYHSLRVQDLYLLSDDAADVALNVFDMIVAESGRVNYFQSVAGTGWLPYNLGGPFDTDAVRRGDSFVTIGGVGHGVDAPIQAAGAGGSMILDPSFGGGSAMYPGEGNPFPEIVGGGWANGSPPNLAGQVGTTVFGLGVFIGRFSYSGDFDLEGSSISISWNQGLGTSLEQGTVSVIPTPGALALLGVAGLTGRRRRGA